MACYLLDDIPESEPDGQTRIEAIDFNSIGRIEVVKGNASSMYTNAPGGVVNFINDIDFSRSFLLQFNQFGSFGLHRNGLKLGIRTKNYGLLNTYSYHHYEGYLVQNVGQYYNPYMPGDTVPQFDGDPRHAPPGGLRHSRISTSGSLSAVPPKKAHSSVPSSSSTMVDEWHEGKSAEPIS